MCVHCHHLIEGLFSFWYHQPDDRTARMASWSEAWMDKYIISSIVPFWVDVLSLYIDSFEESSQPRSHHFVVLARITPNLHLISLHIRSLWERQIIAAFQSSLESQNCNIFSERLEPVPISPFDLGILSEGLDLDGINIFLFWLFAFFSGDEVGLGALPVCVVVEDWVGAGDYQVGRYRKGSSEAHLDNPSIFIPPDSLEDTYTLTFLDILYSIFGSFHFWHLLFTLNTLILIINFFLFFIFLFIRSWHTRLSRLN